MAGLETFDFVLFGGSGDLAMRKLLPALYYRHRDSGDTEGWRILALGRQRLDAFTRTWVAHAPSSFQAWWWRALAISSRRA